MATQKELKNLQEVANLLADDLAKIVEKNKAEIIEGLMVLAKGVFTWTTTLDEKMKEVRVRSYSRYPDKDVAQYLLNQFIGKPKQKVEVSGDPDRPLIVQVAPEIAAKYNLSTTPAADGQGGTGGEFSAAGTPGINLTQSDVTPSSEGNSTGSPSV